ncbi:hypothetical protein TPHA_0B01300 [Tetrapisispora phaffii CBS 4417]|uniref:Very-long-chain (3R)-3-hydroxyacyl-CoA dehydratase n=1 Tax=Tetrapisispora phaffii (strain ATCC 24235 / CBS 4417 / NBRC 1672 / NRRL Y-8282 / UCD 70-5) TaxID=1071381 RepID=G8BP72_TETPH|nr:hypothetical protein TPHA_0B01300 [Tetrapisispora phaffii CBS 4417]CCE61803.1 hypothetical protein TPHA_0B01300 [Tetrapisispora phaffii CBS 4417]
MAKKLISCTSPLALYNLFSALAWGSILFYVVFVYNFVGQPDFFIKSNKLVIFVQCGAIIEIFNSLFGIVRSPLFTTVAQVASRLLVVIGVFYLLPETPACHDFVYVTLLFAWSLTETVRYLFYFYQLTTEKGAPTFLLLLRYNLFIVLYPLGVTSELVIIYSSLAVAERLYSTTYKYTLIFSMLTYMPGLPMLFTHMVVQRSKIMQAYYEEQEASSKKKE